LRGLEVTDRSRRAPDAHDVIRSHTRDKKIDESDAMNGKGEELIADLRRQLQAGSALMTLIAT
jgi:hypothetical protein